LLKSRSDQAGVSGNDRNQDGKPVAGRGDKDDRRGLPGVDEEQAGPRAGRRPSRGSGPDQQPHQDAEIVAGAAAGNGGDEGCNAAIWSEARS
jgi:hypothetical protein